MNLYHNWIPEGIYFHNLEPLHLKDAQKLSFYIGQKSHPNRQVKS